MTVEERLEALEKEVQRLKDIEEIKALKSRYFAALDTKDWEGLKATFHPDVTTSYSDGKLSFHGPEEVANYMAENMPQTEITLHQGHTPEIIIVSDTEAIGHWYLQDNLIFAQGNPYEGLQIQGSALYTDKYEKVDGKWLIKETGGEHAPDRDYPPSGPYPRNHHCQRHRGHRPLVPAGQSDLRPGQSL